MGLKIKNNLGHMTQMTAMPTYIVRTFKKIFFSGTQVYMILKLDMLHRGLKHYKICIKDDPVGWIGYESHRPSRAAELYEILDFS